jgi:hypothetical protein
MTKIVTCQCKQGIATVAGKLRTSRGGIFISLCVWSLSCSSEERFLIASGCFSETEIKVIHHLRFLESIASSETDKNGATKDLAKAEIVRRKMHRGVRVLTLWRTIPFQPQRPFDMPLIFGLHAGEMHPGATLSRQRKNSIQPPAEARSGDSENE